MALTTPTDLITLSSRNFLVDYAANRLDFVAAGKIVYQNLLTHGGIAPAPADVENPLGVFIQGLAVFNVICAAKQYLNPAFYPTFAFALARYIIDNEWNDITAP